jgi:hypothetical protein
MNGQPNSPVPMSRTVASIATSTAAAHCHGRTRNAASAGKASIIDQLSPMTRAAPTATATRTARTDRPYGAGAPLSPCRTRWIVSGVIVAAATAVGTTWPK